MTKLDQYLKTPERNALAAQIKNIDAIYLINLDSRPAKLQSMCEQFAPFAICPWRLPAVYGWGLTSEQLQDIGLNFQPGMDGGEEKIYKPALRLLEPRNAPLDASHYGKACFHPRTTPGAVGCMLSHLSVLQDAVNQGYRTIWVLEDDVRIERNPHLLSNRINELDEVTGGEWDALYTDDRTWFEPFTPGTVWRPDLPLDYEALYQHVPAGEHFYRIGGRCQAHSVIFRQSGMEKILKFLKERGMFMAYDVEIAFVPGIRFYSLKEEIVWGGLLTNTSDTDVRYFC